MLRPPLSLGCLLAGYALGDSVSLSYLSISNATLDIPLSNTTLDNPLPPAIASPPITPPHNYRPLPVPYFGVNSSLGWEHFPQNVIDARKSNDREALRLRCPEANVEKLLRQHIHTIASRYPEGRRKLATAAAHAQYAYVAERNEFFCRDTAPWYPHPEHDNRRMRLRKLLLRRLSHVQLLRRHGSLFNPGPADLLFFFIHQALLRTLQHFVLVMDWDRVEDRRITAQVLNVVAGALGWRVGDPFPGTFDIEELRRGAVLGMRSNFKAVFYANRVFRRLNIRHRLFTPSLEDAIEAVTQLIASDHPTLYTYLIVDDLMARAAQNRSPKPELRT